MKRSVFLVLVAFINACFLNAQATWTQKADFPGSPRDGEVGFCIGTKCYMGLGVYGTGSPGGGPPLFKDFWEWDPATNTWTQKVNFGGGSRYGAVAFSIGNKGYIATGYNLVTNLNDLWEYDPSNDTWTQKAYLPGPGRSQAVAFTIGTKAYIGTAWQDFWEWDQATDTWTQKANYPGGPRVNAVAFSIGNKGYIGGGRDSNNVRKDFWEWDQGTNTWTQKADLPSVGGPAFSLGNIGYVGISCSNGAIWQWDLFTNVWTVATSYAGTSCGPIGFSNGMNAFVGMGGSYGANDFWEFGPSKTMGITDSKGGLSYMEVFPNPTRHEFTITYTSPNAEKLEVSVKNSLGQIIFTDRDTNFSGVYKKTVQLNSNFKGIYFVEVSCGAEHQIRKIVLE